MDTQTQTVEQFLFEQLEKIAPGKYTLAGVLQMFKTKLRFACTHLKGGRTRGSGLSKDYNLSVFTYATGVTEVKCLYGCGLSLRSTDSNLKSAFTELIDIARNHSTNSPAKSESIGKVNPGPMPTYSDEYRKRIRDSNDQFLNTLMKAQERGLIEPGGTLLGWTFPHPDPIDGPESIIERGITHAYIGTLVKKIKSGAVEPAVTNTKIRKARKTQSRKRGSKG